MHDAGQGGRDGGARDGERWGGCGGGTRDGEGWGARHVEEGPARKGRAGEARGGGHDGKGAGRLAGVAAMTSNAGRLPARDTGRPPAAAMTRERRQAS